jgi:NAD(P)-dependent dehydrogenase (short-subunit alcohol dehydrogenase family)
MAKSGIRINSIMPGPTDTPLSRANPDVMFKFAADYRADTGTKMSTPKEQAQALVFLGSRAAVGINGVNLLVDAGYVSAGLSGAYPAPLLKAMLAS